MKIDRFHDDWDWSAFKKKRAKRNFPLWDSHPLNSTHTRTYIHTHTRTLPTKTHSTQPSIIYYNFSIYEYVCISFHSHLNTKTRPHANKWGNQAEYCSNQMSWSRMDPALIVYFCTTGGKSIRNKCSDRCMEIMTDIPANRPTYSRTWVLLRRKDALPIRIVMLLQI